MLRVHVLPAVAVLAVVLAGCGSGNDDKKSATQRTFPGVTLPATVAGAPPKAGKGTGKKPKPQAVAPKPAGSASDRGFRRSLNRRCVNARQGVVAIALPKDVEQARSYSREMLPPARRTVAVLRASRPTAGTQQSVSALAASYAKIVPLFEQLAGGGGSSAQLRQLTPLLAKATGQAFAAGFVSCAPTAATRRK